MIGEYKDIQEFKDDTLDLIAHWELGDVANANKIASLIIRKTKNGDEYFLDKLAGGYDTYKKGMLMDIIADIKLFKRLTQGKTRYYDIDSIDRVDINMLISKVKSALFKI